MSGHTVSQLLKKLLKHGQILILYPAAFDSDHAKQSSEQEASLSSPGLATVCSGIGLQTSDGVTLRSFFLPFDRNPQWQIPSSQSSETTPPRATVILFHGNGYHAWDHIDVAENFVDLKCNVLLLEYRGYGRSDGRPSEKGLRRDAQAALDYVLADPVLSQYPIVVHGTSLGGAVAVDLTSRNPTKVSALIIENTFLSVPSMAHLMTKLSYVFWIHQKWDSASKIRKVPRTTPLLMLSGARDTVVPPQHMRQLWKIAQLRGAGKTGESGSATEESRKDKFISFPEGNHESTWDQRGYWDRIDQFLTSLTEQSTS